MNKNVQQSSPSDFFVAGGTLSATAGSYVSRAADEQLFDLAAAGDFCYVLTTRQMGKSSLMVRTEARLREQGIRTAILDLTAMGSNTEETWYLDLLTELADQLRLTQDTEEWWKAHAALGAVRRFSSFLRDVVLHEINEQIVVFVDEIDSTLGLSFADNFFAAIRAFYNARAVNTEYSRLTFAFFGVAAPADLIKDRTTPFNIGTGIELRDFNRTDAAVLQQGLEAVYPGQGELILDRIYYWTNGHPYLTQKLCHEAVDTKRSELWTDMAVDEMVAGLFLSNQTNREQNLQFVQDRIVKSPQRRKLLSLYRDLLANRKVVNDEQSTPQNQLKLAGLVKAQSGNLQVHNEIYRRVFNKSWVKENTPRDHNRLITGTAVAIAVLAIIVMGYSLWYNSAKVPEQAQNLQFDFTNTTNPQERVERLADLFELHGIGGTPDFDSVARELFFGLQSRQEQLELFKDKNERIVIVIKGLYTTLADTDNTTSSDPLLQAMADALYKLDLTEPVKTLRNEINSWLTARQSARQNQLQSASDAYDIAISLNHENPATLYERAKVSLALQSYSLASRDLDQVIAIARRAPVASATVAPSPTMTTAAGPTFSPTVKMADVLLTAEPSPLPTVLPQSAITLTKTSQAGSQKDPTMTPIVVKTPTTSLNAKPAPQSTETPVPSQTNPATSTSIDVTRPFKSNFATNVQVFNAVKTLVLKYPGMFSFLNAANGDYRNLQEIDLFAFSPADASETLIIVADFEDRSGGKYLGPDPAQYIFEQLTAQVKKDNLAVRVERLRRTLDDNNVRPTGETYSATLLLWGWYDAFTVTPRIERIKMQSDYQSTEAGKHFSLADPTRVESTLLMDLPGPTTYLTLLTLGLDKYSVDQLDAAITDFSGAIESISNNAGFISNPSEAYYFRGRAYERQLKYAEALTDYSRAIEINPQYVEAFIGVAKTYSNQGRYAEAIAAYDQAIQLQPAYADAYFGRGITYSNMGIYDQAIANYDRAIQLQPDYFEVYINRGSVYVQKSDYDRAIADYDQAIRLKPEDAMAHIYRGRVYAQKGDYNRAIANYDQAIQLKPDYAGAYSSLGDAYTALDETRKAIESYQQALQIVRKVGDRSSEEVVLSSIGNAYVSSGETSKALESYQQALQIVREVGDRSSEEVVLSSIGNAYVSSGETSKALESYQQALQIVREVGDRSSEGVVLSSIGNAYVSSGETSKALEFYQQALAISREIGDRSGEGDILVRLGNVYAKLGDTGQAIDHFNQAIQLRPDYAEAYYSRALAYKSTSETDKAIADLRRVLELTNDPNLRQKAQDQLKLLGAQ
jgi:tetratricopeptide (TPR) repeat protein